MALIQRQYHYDITGNLIQTEDKYHGNTDYAYDPLGQIIRAADERFAFDPAHNIIDNKQLINGNRLPEYQGIRYHYDGLGNVTERHSATESQYYQYDADNQLIEARIEPKGRPIQDWHYRYDPFGRRISKTNAKTQQKPCLRGKAAVCYKNSVKTKSIPMFIRNKIAMNCWRRLKRQN